MTSNPKFIISREDLGNGKFLLTVTISDPSRTRSPEAELELMRCAWDAVVRKYGVKSDAAALEIAPPSAVLH